METSFYVIKPHGLIFREEVRAMIEETGLIITNSKTFVINEWVLKIIYSDLPEMYREVVFRPFKDASVEMGLVRGEKAIETLLRVTGLELDPIDCDPDSIRFKLGERKPLIVDGVRCYKNIIHRARDEEEAKKGIELFLRL